MTQPMPGKPAEDAENELEISVQTFLKSLLSILLNLILAFAIISKLGEETTSFAAIL